MKMINGKASARDFSEYALSIVDSHPKKASILLFPEPEVFIEFIPVTPEISAPVLEVIAKLNFLVAMADRKDEIREFLRWWVGDCTISETKREELDVQKIRSVDQFIKHCDWVRVDALDIAGELLRADRDRKNDEKKAAF